MSNPQIATLSASTPNSQITVNSTGNGMQTLSAKITNSCGLTATKTISFWQGLPAYRKLLTYTNIPYDQYQLNFPYTNPTWSFSTQNPNDLVDEFIFKNLDNTTIVTKLAINGQVIVSASELGISHGQTLSFYVYTKNVCGTVNPFKKLLIQSTVYYPTICQYGIGTDCHLQRTDNPDNGSEITTKNKSNDTKVYPNPSHESIKIEIKNTEVKTNAALFDMYGLPIEKIIIENGKAILDVKKYPKGIYILKININGIEENHQIIVK